MFRQATLALCTAITLYGTAQAGGTSPFSISVGGGTLGLTGELGFKSDSLGVRGNVNYFHFSNSSSRDGVNFTDDIDLKSYGVLGDWYPGGEGVRLTSGLLINKNRVGIKGSPGQSAKIGNNTYSSAAVTTLNGSIENNIVSPYVGVGYVADFASGLQLSADLGALLHGKSKVSLSSSNNSVSQSDLDIEASNIKSTVDKTMFYPVLSLKLGYRF
jgi:hypothetical protein